MIVHDHVKDHYPRYHKIRCYTCAKDLPNKSALGWHKGHEVHYQDQKGNIDD